MKPFAVIVASIILSSAVPLARADVRPVQSATLKHGDLVVEFRDNSTSPKALSGVQSLFNTQAAEPLDAYDPDSPGASAGLNFEHIISGHQNPGNKFTPRSGRYTLFATDDGKSVKLVRKRSDSPWDVSSTLTYTLVEPHYVDFEFRCTPHDATLFGKRGWALFFFANYMNDVADAALNFRGIDKPGGPEKWIAASAPEGPADYRGGGTYRHLAASGLEYDDDVRFRLNSWSYDFPRFTKPFYFGRAANSMTLMLMFDRAHSEADEIRFSLFKFKMPKFPRPAWDFQYVIHNVESGREYGFKGRLVWKKFVSPADCLSEYESWTIGLKAAVAN